MNRGPPYEHHGPSSGSVERGTGIGSPTPRRKSSRLGGVFRRIFGRRSVRSQISLPTPPPQRTRHESSPLIASAADARYPRAVSLPVRKVSPQSALGSNPPSADLRAEPPRQRIQRQPGREQLRPRRASVPSVIINDEEGQLTRYGDTNLRFGFEGDSQPLAQEEIGFAITSGSNPKRRSRSADALHYDDDKTPPFKSRHSRGRSDEIKFWREGIDNPNAFDFGTSQDTHEAQEPHRDSASAAASETADATDAPEDVEEEQDPNRATFDFGIVAAAMQEQQKTSMEERLVTVEVKLMDLEYAISKIQARSRSRGRPGPSNLPPEQQTPRAGSRPGIPPKTTLTLKPSPTPPDSETAFRSSPPASNTVSRQTTPKALSRHPFLAPQGPFTDSHRMQVAKQPVPGFEGKPKFPIDQRSSITSLTIDHYATLIAIIQREQKARIRLEDQLADLRRQIATFKPTSRPYSRCRSREWDEGSEALPIYGGTRRVPSGDETDTSEGFHDTYETPTEGVEYEGRPFERMTEGEAF